MYDAIVVGARCAGSATALLLARKGFRVLLVDRAHFPSDTISGHFVLHRGTVRLKRWGLLERVLASNCPPITHITTNFGDFSLAGDVPWIDNAPPALAPRRTVLDTMLVEAASEAGAEVRQGFIVEKMLFEGEQVVGICGRDEYGTMVNEHARIVIGADGKRSRIAQMVNAPVYMEVPSLTCWYMTYFSNYPCQGLEMHWRPHRLVFNVPTNDRLTLQVVVWPHDEFHVFRRDIERNFMDTLRLMPEVAQRLPDARREETFYAMADVPSFFRKPYGMGWALVGDAGHHKDPVPAYGISDAFCDAELLSEALDDGFSGREPLDQSLANYEQRRNTRAIPDHEMTCQRATLEGWDNPEALMLRQALRGNEADTSWFYTILTKAADPEPFFSSQNLGRILQSGR